MTLPAQDIVERLREPEFVTTDTGRLAADLIESQADTISRLTADNEALRSALEAERAAMDVTQRRAISAESRADALALRELVQKAFKDGVLYGTNVDVSDVWQAWLSSKVREELAALGDRP